MGTAFKIYRMCEPHTNYGQTWVDNMRKNASSWPFRCTKQEFRQTNPFQGGSPNQGSMGRPGGATMFGRSSTPLVGGCRSGGVKWSPGRGCRNPVGGQEVDFFLSSDWVRPPLALWSTSQSAAHCLQILRPPMLGCGEKPIYS